MDKIDLSQMNKSIKMLGLSVKTYNVLNRAGIRTVELIVKQEKEKGGLKRVRNLGIGSYKEIKSVLNGLGIII